MGTDSPMMQRYNSHYRSGCHSNQKKASLRTVSRNWQLPEIPVWKICRDNDVV